MKATQIIAIVVVTMYLVLSAAAMAVPARVEVGSRNALVGNFKNHTESRLDDPNPSHYGNPNNGTCLPDEITALPYGIPYDTCSSSCNGGAPSACPTDLPQGSNSSLVRPGCVFNMAGGSSNDHCGLICDDTLPVTSGCPFGSQCVLWSRTGLNLCLYSSCTTSGNCEPIGGSCCNGWHHTLACTSTHRCN